MTLLDSNSYKNSGHSVILLLNGLCLIEALYRIWIRDWGYAAKDLIILATES